MSDGPDSARQVDRGWLDAPAIHAVAVVMGAAALLLGDGLLRWVGAALLLGFSPPLGRLYLGRAPRLARLRPWLPHLLLTALVLALLGELALGRPPATRDHGIHYFQTQLLVHDLIPRGRINGWSERLNHGYPFGDSYPVLGYLLAGGPYLLSGGALTLRTSYAWFLLALWVGSALSVWWVARLVAVEIWGERPDPPALPDWAGFAAASLWLLDPGSARQGGWNYLMFHGVWPQQLSTMLWVLGLSLTWRALQRPTPRVISLAALCLGGAVLGHPFGLLTVAATAAAWPVIIELTGARERLAPGPLRTWLVIHVAAGSLCAGWLLGFLASASYMGRSPVPWEPLPALVAELFAGELFDHTRAWAGVLAVIGGVTALRRGRTLGALVILVGLGLLVLASEAAVTVLRLDLVLSSFKNLQFPRYSIAIKPLWFSAAGVGAGWLIAHARAGESAGTFAHARAPAWRRALVVVALAPMAVAALDGAGYLVPRPVGGLHTLESSRHREAERALTAALREEAARLGERRLTVAFFRTGMGGGTYPLYSITDASPDAHVVLDGHIPSVNFRYRVRERDLETLTQLGVTHVIHDQPLTRGDAALTPHLEHVGSFGEYALERVVAPGLPPVRGVALEDGRGIRVAASDGNGRVVAPFPPYRNWVARAEGAPLEHETGRLTRGLVGLAVQPPAGADAVEFRYEERPVEVRARWVSLIALLGMLAALASGREVHWTERLEAERTRRISRVLFVLTLGVVLAFAVRRQARQLAHTWQAMVDGGEEGSSGLRFRRDLVASGALHPQLETDDRCDGMLGKDAMADCAPPAESTRVSMAYKSPYLFRCLHVNVPGHASTRIPLRPRANETAIQGFVVHAGGPGSSRELLVSTGEADHGRTLRRTRSFRATGAQLRDDYALVIENRDEQAQQVCVAAAAFSDAD